MKKRISIAGILFILIGIVILLKGLGLINFTVWQGFAAYWPLALVLIGAALVFKMRALAFAVFSITVILGALYVSDNIILHKSRDLLLEQVAKPGIDMVKLDLDYGAGDLTVHEGAHDSFVINRVTTTDLEDPEIVYDVEDGKAHILMRRAGSFPFWGHGDNSWDIGLSRDVPYEIDIDYGASEAAVDLTGLQVERLDMESGATDTKIVFDAYPTEAHIFTGASSIEMKFPKGYGIVVDIDAGISSIELRDFTEKDGRYYSSGYDADRDNIEVSIEAGASSIEAGFY